MAEGIQTFISPDLLPESIVRRVAVVQHKTLVHHRHDILVPDFHRLEILSPQCQVVDCGKQARRTRVGIVQSKLFESSGNIVVGVCAVLHDLLVIHIKKCVGHAERIEDVLFCPIVKRHSCYPVNDFRQQRKAGVTVEHFLTRLEIKFGLTADHAHDLLLGDDVVDPPTRHEQQVPLVAQSAGVVDEVVDRDRHTEVVQLGQVLPDIVLQ